MLLALFAQAQTEPPQFVTVDGRLYDSTTPTNPLLDASVALRIQVLNPAKTCILYEEQQAVNTLAANGYFNVRVGSPTSGADSLKRSANDSGNTMMTVFQNQNSAITGKTSSGIGCSYTPSSGDARYFRFVVTPSTTGVTTQLSPDMTIDSVPQALVAESLQGLSTTDFVQISANVTQAKLESLLGTSYATLTGLLAGTSSLYLQNTVNGTVIPSRPSNPASPTAGQIWYDSTANNLKYYDGTTVQTLGIGGGDPTKLPLAGGTMTGAIAMGSNDITAVGHITQSAQRTFRFGGYTGGQETTLITTPLTAGQEGTVWYNTTTDKLMYWDGTGSQTVLTVSSANSLVPNCTSTQSLQMSAGPIYVWSCVNTTDASKLPLAGGTMTGSINMGSNDITSSGHITLSAQRTLRLGGYTTAQQTTLVGALIAGQEGTTWYNTTTNKYMYWDGTPGVARELVDSTQITGMGDITAVNTGATSGLSGGAVSGAVTLQVEVDNTGIEINGSNDLQLKDSGVTSNKIADGAIMNVDINNSAAIAWSKIDKTGATAADVNAVAKAGDAMTGALTMNAQNQVRYADAAGGEYAAIQAPTTIGTNYVLTLPTTAGSSGQVLQTDGTGVLSWIAIPSAPVSSVFGRTGAVVATAGDYTATQVTNTAAGNIAATTVQAAVNELDTEKVAKAGDTMTGNLVMDNQREVRFVENGSTNYMAIRANATMAGDFTLTLPVDDGVANQVLTTDGSGNLTWTTPAAVGETNTASNVTGSTGVGIYKQKTGVNLEFKSLLPGSTKLSISGGVSDVTLDVVETNLNLANIPNTAAGNIAATNAQAAINELDTEKVAKAGDAMTGALTMNAQNQVRYADAAGGEYAAIQAPTTIGTNYVLTLPTTAGSSGQVLQTDGTGVLNWIAIPSAPVSSVFGRTGAVVSANGDYTASQVTNVAAGNIAATDVQAALNELDTEKVPTMRTITTTANTSGLTGGGDLSANRSLSVDITGTTAETVPATGDEILIYDVSATALRKMTRSNFLTGYLTSEVDTLATVTGRGANTSTNITMDARAEVRLADTAGGEYAALKAPATIGTNYVLTLPDTAGSAGQVLQTDGTGVLSWIAIPSAPVSSVFGRTGAVVATAGDYTATQVTNTAAGNIAAITVQTALNELDTEKVAKAGDSMTGALTMNAQNQVRYADAAGGEYAAIQAPTTIGTNYVLTLPDTAGTNGQVLTTNGSGVLSWTTPTTGDITDVVAGNGLTGGATSGSATLDIGAGAGISVAADSISVNINGTTAETVPAGVDEILIYDASATALRKMTRSDFLTGYLTSEVDTLATVTGRGANTSTNITMDARAEVRLADTAGGEYAALKAPATIATNYILTLPTTAGSTGQVLQTDGTGVLSWITIPSAPVSSVFGRTGAVVATAGDYTATQLTNTAAGNIAATTVQAALNELDTEKVAKTGDTMTGNLVMDNQREVRFVENGSTNFMAIRANATMAGDFTLTLPADDGNSGQYLQTDGSGNLSWVTPAGVGETNTASNQGVGGVGLYDSKVTFDLQFRNINAASNKVTVALDAPNKEVDINVNEANFNLASIPNTAAGNIAATNAQAAINELDTEKVAKAGDAMTGALTMNAQNQVRYADAAGGEYAAIQAPTTIGTNYVLTLPTTAGSSGQVLQTDGTGVLSWIAIPSAPVTSVFGRTGAVVSANGDYTASQVTNVAAGNIAAITVQNALNELDTEKVATTRAINTVANSGLTGGGDLSADRSLSVNITGTTAETVPAAVDEILIYDVSATALRKMARSDFLTGYLTSEADTLATVTGRGANTSTNITMDARAEVRLADTAGGEYVALKAPATIGTNYTLTLPATAGVSGQILSTDGTGILSWINSPLPSADSLNFTEFADAMTLDASTDIAATGTNVLSITNSGTGDSFRVNDQASDTSPFIIDPAGQVGIGTTSPGSALDVVGASAGQLQLLNIINTQAAASGVGPRMGFQGSGANNMAFISTRWQGAANTDADLTFATRGAGTVTEKMRIEAGGNVGIGTTVPGTLLDVAGAITSRPYGTSTGNTGQLILRELAAGGTDTVAIRAPDAITTSYSLTLPTTAGAANQVLTTDGAGLLSWSTALTGASSVDALSDGIAYSGSTFVGTSAGAASSASSNTGFGYRSLQTVTTSNYNAAFGTDALRLATSGSNTAVGGLAARNTSTGQSNVAVGRSALDTNTTGSFATALGTYALTAIDGSDGNTAVGSSAMRHFISGTNNTALGYSAGQGTTTISTGSNNTFLGYAAGSNAELADSNTFIGASAGNTIVNGDSNIFIGASVTLSGDPSSKLNIGNTIYGDLTTDYVGIGTTTPGSMLQLGTAGASLGTFRMTGNTSGYVQIQPAAAAGSWTMTLPGSAGSSGQVLRTDGAGVLSWVAAGTPSADSLNFTEFADAMTLDASTDIAVTGSNVFSITNTGTGNSFVVNDQASDTTAFKIDADGNVGIGADPVAWADLFVQGWISTYGIYMIGGGGVVASSGSEIHLASDSGWTSAALSPGGSPILTALATGNVGIGTTTPGAMLQLGTAGTSLGTFRMTGSTSGFVQIQPSAAAGSWTMTLPTSAGASGQILSTDGAGILSWISSPLPSADSLNFTEFADAMTLDASTDIAATGTNVLSITNSGTGNSFVVNDQASDTSPFVIDASGNVGIGTTAPSDKLHVAGVLFASGWIQTGGTVNTAYSSSGAIEYPMFGAATASQMYIQNSSTVDGSMSLQRFSVRNSSSNNQNAYIAAVSNAGAGVYSPNIVFGQQTAGSAYSERMRIDSSGNVGIGTTTPGAMLQLGTAGTSLGTFRMTGNTSGFVQIQPSAAAGSWTMTLPGSAGSSGQVLSTDGTGILSWINSPLPSADSLNFTEFADAMTLDASTDIAATGTNVLSITNSGTGNSFVVNDQASDTSPFVVDASGNVGIGSSAPASALDVVGTISASSMVNASGNITSTNGTAWARFVPTGWISVSKTSASTASMMEVTNTSTAVNSGGSIDFQSGAVVRAKISGHVGSGTGNRGYIKFETNVNGTFTEVMRLDQYANVGIGTTVPVTLLDVAGAITSRPSGTGTGQTGQLIMRELAASPGGTDTVTIRAPDSVGTSFALTLPGTAGSSGQILSTDGTGILSWISSPLPSADSLNFTEFADAMTLDASTDIAVTGTNVLSVTNSGTGNSFVVNDQASDTTPFVVDAAGNVGIGSSAPTGTLDVNGGAAAANTAGSSITLRAQNSTGPAPNIGGGLNFYTGTGAGGWGDGDVNFFINGGRFIVSSPGDAYSATGAYAGPTGQMHMSTGNYVDGTSALNSFSVRNSASDQRAYFGAVSNTGGVFYTPSLVWGQQTGASSYAERMRMDASGNLGIGTTAPGAMLQLGTAGTSRGTMRMTGNTSGFVQIQPSAAAGSWTMTLPTSAGSSGQVLQTDGSGTLSWATVTASGGTYQAAAGSQGTPSLTFSTDVDSGFYSAGDGSIGVTANNTLLAWMTNGYTTWKTPFSLSMPYIWGGTYSPTSVTDNTPIQMIGLQSTNENNEDNSISGYLMSVGNTATNRQNAYMGTLAVSGGFSPAIVFGQQTGATAYNERMRINQSGNVGIGTTNPTSTLTVNGSMARNIATVTAATYSISATDTHIIANRAGTITVTLPSAASFPGREITIRTITANTVVSASSNVVPMVGGAAGTAILAATAGRWAMLVSDGTNWQIQMGN